MIALIRHKPDINQLKKLLKVDNKMIIIDRKLIERFKYSKSFKSPMIKKRSPGEQERVKKEMDEYRKKYGLKALNEKLKKFFGL